MIQKLETLTNENQNPYVGRSLVYRSKLHFFQGLVLLLVPFHSILCIFFELGRESLSYKVPISDSIWHENLRISYFYLVTKRIYYIKWQFFFVKKREFHWKINYKYFVNILGDLLKINWGFTEKNRFLSLRF